MKFYSQILKFSNSQILFAALAWSLLILRFGYRFGTGDHVELLPYTIFLNDSTLYAHDFFIQGLNTSVPNERTIMAHLLLPFVNHLELFCFVFQFLTSIMFVLGLVKLTRRFIQNTYVAWLAILVALIPLNDFGLGNVELYSECFQASGLAVAIIVWAINFFLDRRYLSASALMSLATFIQLLEGLDIMMVLSAILFLAAITKEVKWKVLVGFTAVYAFTAGVYLVMIFIQKNVTAGISNQELFNILFEFRHPHHFIFSAFPKAKMLVFFALTAISLLFFALRSKQLFHLVLIGLVGVIVYAIAVDGLHNVFIGNFQFYKITQWVKVLGVVALFGFVEQFLSSFIIPLRTSFERVGLIVSIVLCWVVILNFNAMLPYKVPFQLFEMKKKDDMIAICEQIKEITPPDAVFVQPFDNTELKFYGERSSYVEFKANVRNKAFVKEWANRVKEVFGVAPDMKVKGFALQKPADFFFYHADAIHLSALKVDGVSYLLTRKEFPPATGQIILQNKTYAVYQL